MPSQERKHQLTCPDGNVVRKSWMLSIEQAWLLVILVTHIDTIVYMRRCLGDPSKVFLLTLLSIFRSWPAMLTEQTATSCLRSFANVFVAIMVCMTENDGLKS